MGTVICGKRVSANRSISTFFPRILLEIGDHLRPVAIQVKENGREENHARQEAGGDYNQPNSDFAA